MIASIHQPNFLPWLGFFNKILRSDVYIVFDDVQFPRGKDYAFRNKIKQPSGETWITLPVSNKSNLVPWHDAIISDTDWKIKHIQQIDNAYHKTPYYTDIMPLITSCYDFQTSSVLEFNLNFISTVLTYFDWHGTVIRSSTLELNTSGLDKIIDILQYVTATEYITGEGAGSARYINADVFENINIKLTYQNFKHPIYTQQHGNFIENMSIIDLLFNEGHNSKEFIL